MGKIRWLIPVIAIYKLSRKLKMDGFLRSMVLPKAYKKQIRELDKAPPVY
jgi:hypothetical protein